jgi:hypothetical protein
MRSLMRVSALMGSPQVCDGVAATAVEEPLMKRKPRATVL